MKKYDLIILGGGAAAFAAANRANQLKKKTLLINDKNVLPLGGTCVNVGCVPSKIILHQGATAYYPPRSAFRALKMSGEVDFVEALKETRKMVREFQEKNYKNVIKKQEYVSFKEGHAKFKDPYTIVVGDEEFKGEKMLIATGASAFIPPIKGIDGAILLSASGGKHAPIIAKDLKKRKIKVILLTNNPAAAARQIADKTFVMPKNAEPYTYNTSTYLSMIIAKTRENPKAILHHINKIKKKIPENFKKYDAFYIIVPEEFDNTREMFLTKFDELFGPVISGRVFTPEQTKHAKTVVSSDREMFISLGYDNKLFGKNRLNIPLPSWAGYATIIAVGYYVIGHIQKQNKPYFRDNIEAYTKNASKLFGQVIKPVVD